jgi:hypothetical protein
MLLEKAQKHYKRIHIKNSTAVKEYTFNLRCFVGAQADLSAWAVCGNPAFGKYENL